MRHREHATDVSKFHPDVWPLAFIKGNEKCLPYCTSNMIQKLKYTDVNVIGF